MTSHFIVFLETNSIQRLSFFLKITRYKANFFTPYSGNLSLSMRETFLLLSPWLKDTEPRKPWWILLPIWFQFRPSPFPQDVSLWKTRTVLTTKSHGKPIRATLIINSPTTTCWPFNSSVTQWNPNSHLQMSFDVGTGLARVHACREPSDAATALLPLPQDKTWAEGSSQKWSSIVIRGSWSTWKKGINFQDSKGR